MQKKITLLESLSRMFSEFSHSCSCWLNQSAFSILFWTNIQNKMVQQGHFKEDQYCAKTFQAGKNFFLWEQQDQNYAKRFQEDQTTLTSVQVVHFIRWNNICCYFLLTSDRNLSLKAKDGNSPLKSKAKVTKTQNEELKTKTQTKKLKIHYSFCCFSLIWNKVLMFSWSEIMLKVFPMIWDKVRFFILLNLRKS